jgi:hypothetical protein
VEEASSESNATGSQGGMNSRSIYRPEIRRRIFSPKPASNWYVDKDFIFSK